MTRAVIFGALAALGVPTITRLTTGPIAEFLRGISQYFEIGGVALRWSWAIFVVVTAFTYIMLLLTKDR